MPTLNRGAFTLSFLDEGSGPALLLLHAYPLRAEMFRPQIDALKGRYRVIAPDHRGFGSSGLPPGAAASTMDELAADALAVLDALELPSAVVGGVSMGGYAALALLRRDAGRVRGLVLMDTQVLADDEAARSRREQAARAALERGMAAVRDAMLDKLLAPGAPAALRGLVERMILENRPEGAAAAQRGMAERLDGKDLLARYAGPALVLVGEQDGITPPEKARQMAELLRSGPEVVIPGAGHLASLEASGEVNRVLAAFLAAA